MKNIFFTLLLLTSFISSSRASDNEGLSEDELYNLEEKPTGFYRNLTQAEGSPEEKVQKAKIYDSNRTNQINLYIHQLKIATFYFEDEDKVKARIILRDLEEKAKKSREKVEQFHDSLSANEVTKTMRDFQIGKYSHEKDINARCSYAKNKYDYYEAVYRFVSKLPLEPIDSNPLISDLRTKQRVQDLKQYAADSSKECFESIQALLRRSPGDIKHAVGDKVFTCRNLEGYAARNITIPDETIGLIIDSYVPFLENRFTSEVLKSHAYLSPTDYTQRNPMETVDKELETAGLNLTQWLARKETKWLGRSVRDAENDSKCSMIMSTLILSDKVTVEKNI